MKEIFINVDSYNSEGIKTIQGNNNAEIYKICISKSKVRLSLVGKTVKLGYVMAGTTKGDIIEDLNITNAEQGEITLPITNKISKKDGIYTCELAIYGADEFLEYTATFGLTVQANIFTKIAEEITDTKDLTYIERILEEAANISEELKSNIPVARQLNIDLENQNRILNENMDRADGVKNTLITTTEQSKEAATDAIEKKSQLESSITKAKEFIDGLDGSQNIPQIRLDVTELQNGLKSNQALEYTGSSISANNTLEGRTEGIKIGGRTLNNLFGAPYTYNMNTPSTRIFRTTLTQGKLNQGDYTLIFKTNFNKDTVGTSGLRIYWDIDTNTSGGYRTVSKVNGINVVKINIPTDIISFLFYIESPDVNNGLSCEISDLMILEGDYEYMNFFEGMKSVGETEQEGDKYKISILTHNKNFFNINEFSEKINEKGELEFKADGNSRVANYMQIYTERNLNSKIIFNGYDSVGREFTTVNQEKYYIWVGLHGDKKDNKVWGEIILPKNTTCYYSAINEKGDNFVKFKNIQIEVGTSKTQYEPYKCDKKDILLKKPLREWDTLYEDNGQVKVDRLSGQYTFTGNENFAQLDNDNNSLSVYVDMNTLNLLLNGITVCNNFNYLAPNDLVNKYLDGISISGSSKNRFLFRISTSKLSTPDIDGFKAWLKANPTTVIYQLATPTTEIVENCVDIDLDTYQEKTYFSIENLLPGTLDFKVPSNIGSVVQNMAKEVNNIWDVINNLLVPSIVKANGNLAMLKLNNNLN
ncbi:TPA: BppU family phage baseplate upper protein [Clostridium perfringens]|nr:BppU family phage baseplate upper protein [Clostridium perfringens]